MPTARLIPFNRHELIEAIALLDSVNRGELDVLQIPEEPIDVLMQQIVAEVSTRADDTPDELFELVRHAYPYRNLARATFDEALDFVSRGVFTGRGQRGQQLSLDPINGMIRPRRSAKHAAIMNGGTIPDLGDYDQLTRALGWFIHRHGRIGRSTHPYETIERTPVPATAAARTVRPAARV